MGYKSTEFNITTKAGKPHWINHISRDVFDASGSFLGIRGSFSDITERKYAEEKLLYLSLHDALTGVWFGPSGPFYVTGDGVFTASDPGGSWTLQQGHPLLYEFAVRGTAENDVVVAGGYGVVSHFNGSTWRHYTSTGELPTFTGNYYAVAISEHLIVAVGGTDHTPAIVAIGRR